MKIGLLATLLFVSTLSFSQSVEDVVYHLIGMNPNDTVNFRDPSQRELLKSFWISIKELDKIEQGQKRLNGRAFFGFSGDQSETQSLYRIDGGIHGRRGGYPAELNFNASIGMVLNNGKFNENVSNLYMSYNLHPNWGDGLFAENYVFINRFSDAFLGVDQRYELGAGMVFAKYSRQLLESSSDQLESINKVEFSEENFNADDSIWKLCSNYCSKFKTTEITAADVKYLEKTQKRSRLVVRKFHSTYRFGILAGLFIESEKITSNTPLKSINGDLAYNYSFEPVQKLRWVVRPTIDLRPSEGIEIKLRPYFKMPFPHDWINTVSSGTASSGAIDYRIDIQSSIYVNLDGYKDTQNKSVGLFITYNLYYDHAPARLFVNDPATNLPILYSANKRHSLLSLGIKVDF